MQVPPIGLAQKSGQPKSDQAKKTGPRAGDLTALPTRGAHRPAAAPIPQVPKEEDKTIEFFRHLNRPRKTTISEAGKDVHQAVLSLGLQIANYTICGSCARLVATLQAFKEVSFREYISPRNISVAHV